MNVHNNTKYPNEKYTIRNQYVCPYECNTNTSNRHDRFNIFGSTW